MHRQICMHLRFYRRSSLDHPLIRAPSAALSAIHHTPDSPTPAPIGFPSPLPFLSYLPLSSLPSSGTSPYIPSPHLPPPSISLFSPFPSSSSSSPPPHPPPPLTLPSLPIPSLSHPFLFPLPSPLTLSSPFPHPFLSLPSPFLSPPSPSLPCPFLLPSLSLSPFSPLSPLSPLPSLPLPSPSFFSIQSATLGSSLHSRHLRPLPSPLLSYPLVSYPCSPAPHTHAIYLSIPTHSPPKLESHLLTSSHLWSLRICPSPLLPHHCSVSFPLLTHPHPAIVV